MRRTILLPVLAAVLVLTLQILPAGAQGKIANLVGYEKAEYVTGLFSLNATGDSVALVGMKTKYDKPLNVYLTRSFDQSAAFKVGEVPAGNQRDLFFDLPALDVGAFDSVLVMVPGWSVPVGVGLLK